MSFDSISGVTPEDEASAKTALKLSGPERGGRAFPVSTRPPRALMNGPLLDDLSRAREEWGSGRSSCGTALGLMAARLALTPAGTEVLPPGRSGRMSSSGVRPLGLSPEGERGGGKGPGSPNLRGRLPASCRPAPIARSPNPRGARGSEPVKPPFPSPSRLAPRNLQTRG
jgi:hypothetical protein